MSGGKLPEGWVSTTIGDISVKCSQRVPDENEQFIYVDIGSINRERKVIENPQYLIGKDAPSRARKEIKAHDIIVSLTRPNLNAVALVSEKYDEQIASTGFEVIRPTLVESRYIFALVRSRHFIDSISGLVQGALYPAAKSSDVQSYEFPLPPLAEQKIIAEKLDTLLAQVDSTKARLEQIPQILKRFRQAVLAAAMNGKLTTQWRLENNELDRINLSDIDFFWRRLRNSKKNKNQHEETLNNACSSNLPETWLNTKIGNVFDVHVGSTPRRNQPEFWNGDIPWVSSSEVAFCRIYATKEMITKKGLASSSTKIHPAGTVMLAMIGQGKTRGQVAILNIDACHNQNTAAIRVPGDFASSEFLYFYLSQRYNDNREIGAGNNQKAMNKSIVESLIFPLPPLKEQHEIVRRVEQLFAYADTIEKQVNNALTRVNSLTQSILAKAFRGELTAQWRAENPDLISGENSAAALLEKIKAERAASGGKKTSRKKS